MYLCLHTCVIMSCVGCGRMALKCAGQLSKVAYFLDSKTLPHDILDSHFDICKYLDVKTIPIKCMKFFFFSGTPPSAHQVKYTAKKCDVYCDFELQQIS